MNYPWTGSRLEYRVCGLEVDRRDTDGKYRERDKKTIPSRVSGYRLIE